MTKYKNIRCEVDGIRFDSRKEANHYCELKLLEKAGAITDLKLQVKFTLHAGIKYIADFTYTENGKTIIEDVKGVRTAVYRLKKKLMAADGYEIREV